MKKTYFLVLFLLVSIMSFGQTEIFNAEGGGAYPSSGWSDVNNNVANLIDRGSYYLIEVGAPSDIINTDSYDLSSYATAQLSFNIKSFGSGTHNSVLTEISYDNGSTYSQSDTSPITTTSYTTHTFDLTSVTSQVKIRFSTVATSGRSIRFQDIILTASTSAPSITITAPSDTAILESGTTAATISVNVANFTVDQTSGSGDGHIHWTVNSVSQSMKYDTLDESITVTDGGSYTVVMTLVDNTHTPLDPVVSSTTTFTVAYPCDLQLGTITTTCDATTNGTDTYTTTIDYTGGGSSTYTIDTASNGTIGGDDPSTVATGTISISGVTEGVDFTTTVTGDTANSSCNITRNITSPVCVVATCANAGDIIITEIMKNPSAVGDSYGEYFEVYNTTTAAIDMQGWQVVDLTSTSEGFTIASSVVVPALGYAVFGVNADVSLNGGVTIDYDYDGLYLGNSGGDELSIQCSGNVIDEVIWDGGTEFPNLTGMSMELSTNAFTATDNDLGANWGAATAAYGDGDLGTPGTVNNFLSIADNVIEGFTIFPNPVKSNYIQITTASSNSKQVRIFDMLGKKIIDKNIQHQLNISALQAGIYIIKVTVDGQSATKRLIVQ